MKYYIFEGRHVKVFVFDNIYINASERAQGSHMTIIT